MDTQISYAIFYRLTGNGAERHFGDFASKSDADTQYIYLRYGRFALKPTLIRMERVTRETIKFDHALTDKDNVKTP